MRKFNLDLNLAPAAKAIAEAMSTFHPFEDYLERTDRILAALAKADLVIVPKVRGNAEAVREAVRTGNWRAVSERDLLAWRDAPREEEAAPADEASERDGPVPTGRVIEVTYAKADGTTETVRHAEYLQRRAVSFDPLPVVGGTVAGTVLRAMETVALQPGNVFELPPGTEIRSADTAVPCAEHDDWGLRNGAADDLAAKYGCRVEISDLDDARYPLSDGGIDDPQFVVVTERATGRVVGLVQAWETDDGDPLVPKNWLEVVLSAWDAARDPQRAA